MASPFVDPQQQVSQDHVQREQEALAERERRAKKRRTAIITGIVTIILAIAAVVAGMIWLWTSAPWNTVPDIPESTTAPETTVSTSIVDETTTVDAPAEGEPAV